MSGPLPPGQRERADFPRFGLPRYVARRAVVPAAPVLALEGDVAAPLALALGELAVLPRREQRSDLHCVTTWSRRDLAWSGWRLRDVWDALIVPRARPLVDVAYLLCGGLDGYRTALPLTDALADDVLLADRLDGVPLPFAHGAPLRLVAPAHYGYKQVKHVGALVVCREAPRESGGWVNHPRARVAHEERARGVPGRLLRWPYRATIPYAIRRARLTP